jgi:hypothetical protein
MRASKPRLPHATPSWWTTDRAALAAFVWPAGTAFGIAFLAFVPALRRTDGQLALVTWVAWLAAQWVLARRALRAITPRAFASIAEQAHAIVESIAGHLATMAVPVAVLVLFVLATEGFAGFHFSWTVVFAIGLVCLVPSVPLGIWCSALAAAVAEETCSPSHETVDRVTTKLGVRLAVPSAIVWSWLVAIEKSFAVVVAPAVLLPALAALVSAVRARRRRRWLAEAIAGKVEGWRVVDVGDVRATDALIPVVAQSEQTRTRVLVARGVVAAAYRDRALDEGVALVEER